MAKKPTLIPPCVFHIMEPYDESIIGCTKGPYCPYEHNICINWLEGNCNLGDDCEQVHYRLCAFNALGRCTPIKLCFHFINGTCRNGDKCKFSHETNPNFIGRCRRAHIKICPKHLEDNCKDSNCQAGLHPSKKIMKELREVYSRSISK